MHNSRGNWPHQGRHAPPPPNVITSAAMGGPGSAGFPQQPPPPGRGSSAAPRGFVQPSAPGQGLQPGSNLPKQPGTTQLPTTGGQRPLGMPKSQGMHGPNGTTTTQGNIIPGRGPTAAGGTGRGFGRGGSNTPAFMSGPGNTNQDSESFVASSGPMNFPTTGSRIPSSQGMSYGGPPPPSSQGMAFSGPPPSTSQEMAFSGPPPSISQGMAFSGPPPSTSQGMGYTGTPPSASQGMGYTGGPPPSSQGMGYGGSTPSSQCIGYSGPRPPPSQGTNYSGFPPQSSQGFSGPPPSASQGMKLSSGPPTGGPPPMSGGLDNSQRLGNAQFPGNYAEGQIGPQQGMMGGTPPMYSSTSSGGNQYPGQFSGSSPTYGKPPQMFSTGSANNGAPPPQMVHPAGAGTYTPNMTGGPPLRGAPGAPTAAKMATVDTSKNCHPAFLCPTINAIPCNEKLGQKTGMPIGLCVHPLAQGPDVPEVPVVDFGTTGPVRCKKCRAYINPFATFIDNGQRWTCNFCSYPNDTPPSYFSKLENGQRVDVNERPELSQGSVELIASSDYMLRAPPPMVYLFLLDVSYNAISSGMLGTAVAAIKEAIPVLLQDSRTQVAFITYDSAVHFYRLRQDNPQPQMYVIPDLSDVSLPALHEDLLVNLNDTHDAVEALLDSLSEMHASNRSADSCLGPAVKAGSQLINHIGGKMVICQSTLPTLGIGKLRQRESPKMLGTDEEHKLLSADSSEDGQFYKSMALECSKSHISVDIFLASNVPYIDVASIGTLARYTAGEVYFYSNFKSSSEGARLHADMYHDLTRITGLEAVLRIRCSAGVSVSSYFGNFFIRGQDLLIMPNVTQDTAFTVQLSIADTLASGSTVTFQSALLYTTTSGSRRILLHTLAVPTASVVAELFSHADIDNMQNLIAKVALDNMLRSGLPAARRYLHRVVVDVVRAYNTSTAQNMVPKSQNDSLINLPSKLELLPLYSMGLSKSVLFRGGQEIHSDERAFLVFQMLTMQATASKLYAYPKMLSLHDMEKGMGMAVPEGEETPVDSEGTPISCVGYSRIKVPREVSLSVEQLSDDGVFLLADGFEMFLWVGKAAPAQLLQSLFGVPSLEGVDVSSAQLPQLNNEYSKRVNAIVAGLQEESNPQMRFRIVKQGASDTNEIRFHWRLVEDRQQYQGGTFNYADYLQLVSRETSVGTGLAR